MKNEEGLRRDATIALEHFGNYKEARAYLIDEFINEYTEEEIVGMLDEMLDEVIKDA